jgi:dipeptidyl aminopeptidase/acylaminoacyl peptidase
VASRPADVLPTGALNRFQMDRPNSSSVIYYTAFAPDGKTLAVTGTGGSIRLWDVATGKARSELSGHLGPVWSVAFSPDGKTLTSGGTDQTLRLWDLETGKELRQFGTRQGVVYAVAFSPDGKVLAGGHGSAIYLWDVDTGKELRQLPGQTGGVWPVAFSPDGRLLAAGSADGSVGLWEVATGRELWQFRAHQGGVWPVVFSPDGKTLVSAGWQDRTLCLWEVATGRQRRQIQHPGGIKFVAFSPCGRSLASGSDDRKIHLWEVSTGKERLCFVGHQGTVLAVAFSPDGKALASGGEDGTTLIWDVTGQPKDKHPEQVVLSQKDLKALWQTLTDADACKAYEAITPLVAAPRQSVPFLREQLHPLETPPPERVAQLLNDLDDDLFTVRERAMAELVRLGSTVEPALRRASLREDLSLEVHRRVDRLLDRLDSLPLCPEKLRVLRAIEVLEQIGTSEARKVLEVLGRGPQEIRETEEAKAALHRMSKLVVSSKP